MYTVCLCGLGFHDWLLGHVWVAGLPFYMHLYLLSECAIHMTVMYMYMYMYSQRNIQGYTCTCTCTLYIHGTFMHIKVGQSCI